ncbi:hypothetical protein ACU8KH_00982 [Lachancea thermotolerans]
MHDEKAVIIIPPIKGIVIGSLVCDNAKLHNDTLNITETLAKEFETLSTNDPDSPQ